VEDPVWGQDVIGAPEIWGVQSFGPAGLTVRVVIPTKPLRNWDVTRQLRERLKLAFEEAGMRMPSQLVELGGQHFGYPIVAASHEDVLRSGQVPRLDALPGSSGAAPRTDPTPSHGATPPSAAPDEAPTDPDATQVLDLGAGPAEPRPRDATEELRILRGPEPRPD
jgi:moderate conductance mechanosensitive channel